MMKIKIKFLPFLLLLFFTLQSKAELTHYVGGDISLLPEYENTGAIYKTHAGKTIPSLLPFLREEGMNAMRVRLFVNPSAHALNYPSTHDPNACQDLKYIIPLCRRIVDAGFKLMLDFHYSDTWADPSAQWTPDDWKDLNDVELNDKIYEYTRDVLMALSEEGVTPAFIQPGNEISYGMLWGEEGAPAGSLKKCFSGSDANWSRFASLLKNAIRACHEVCPDAKIVIHTERVAQPLVQNNLYKKLSDLGVDYDIIGLSYYPYFHGGLDVLKNSLESLQTNFPDKTIMIVETGYPYKWEVPGTGIDNTATWKYSDAGQNKFVSDLISTLDLIKNVRGIFWWWLEYNAYHTSLSGWYNAPLFDSTTGKATSALSTLCSFAKNSDVKSVYNEYDSNIWYDMNGIAYMLPPTPGMYIHNHKLVIIR